MPYGQEYTRRVRRPVYAFAKKKGKVAKLERKVAKISRHLSGVEIKSYAVLFNSGDMGQNTMTMVADNISSVALGSGDGNRIGDRIRITGIDLNYVAWASTAETQQGQMQRLVIVRDKQFDGTNQPIGSQILSNYDAASDLRVLNFISPTSMDYIGQTGDAVGQKRIKRFQVLYDKVITFPTQTPQPVKHRRIRLRFKNGLDANYSGTTNLGGTIFFCVFPGRDTTAGTNPLYSWESRIYFKDL